MPLLGAAQAFDAQLFFSFDDFRVFIVLKWLYGRQEDLCTFLFYTFFGQATLKHQNATTRSG